MQIAFPFQLDGRGRTALADPESHIRQMIEQLLFTSPGERVNRPDFGCGLMQFVFAPGGSDLDAALQFTVQSAIQRWLGDLIDLRELRVDSSEGNLSVNIRYAILGSDQDIAETFERGAL